MTAIAIGLVSRLVENGVPPWGVNRWFRTPRRELGGLCPADALTSQRATARELLELADRDMADLRAVATI